MPETNKSESRWFPLLDRVFLFTEATICSSFRDDDCCAETPTRHDYYRNVPWFQPYARRWTEAKGTQFIALEGPLLRFSAQFELRTLS